MPYSVAQGNAVVFDLDGTLLDTLGDLALATNKVLTQMGHPVHPVDAYRFFVGDGAGMLVRRALPEGTGDGEHGEALALFREEYGANMTATTRLYPGVAELLDLLTARAMPMGIVTNKPDEPTQFLAGELLSRWSFVTVSGQREGVPRKPDPTRALAAAKLAGVPPADCLFVGDSAVDIHTARNAGMVPIGVAWGFRPQSELREAGAHAVIAQPDKLLGFL